jgi:hypothetical protein
VFDYEQVTENRVRKQQGEIKDEVTSQIVTHSEISEATCSRVVRSSYESSRNKSEAVVSCEHFNKQKNAS